MTGIDLGAAPEKGSQKPLLNLGLVRSLSLPKSPLL